MKKTIQYYFTFLLLFLGTRNFVFAQDGSLDPSFGTAGKVITNAADEDEAYDITIQPDGRIIVVGNCKIGDDQDIVLIRYNADGTLDNSFDFDGKVITPLEENQFAKSVFVQSDQKIIVGGYVTVGTKSDLLILRYHRDGSPDLSFDLDGFVVTNLGSSKDYIYSIAAQPDGKIIVGGSTSNGGGAKNDFLLMRYNYDGSIDSTFGIDGRTEADFNYSKDYGQAMLFQPDGKIIVAGYSANFEADDDFALARFNSNGFLDSTFGTNGKVTRDGYGADDQILSIALQVDGKIVAAGRTNVATQLDFALMRFNSDGSFDNTFNDSGIVVTSTGATVEILYKVLLQADQKILVTGYRAGGASADFVLMRYNTDGSIDSTFDADGIVLTDFGTTSDRAYTAIIQTDGKIIAAGYTYNGFEYDFAVIRFNQNMVSVETTEELNTSTLFPNPANNTIYLKLKNTVRQGTMRIISISGQTILTQQNLSGNSFTFDISNFATGLYLVEINNGDFFERIKFVKN